MPSVAILASSRSMFWCSLGLASLGTLLTVKGSALLTRAWFLH